VTLEERVAEVAGARNAADAAAVDLVADVIETGAWEGQGLGTAAGWTAWKFGVTRHRAHVFCAIARRRSELPAAMQSFGEGRLSVEQMYLLARHCPAEFEASVANFARFATIAQLSKTLRNYSFGEPDEDRNRPTESTRSRASLSFDPDGRFRFTAGGDAEQGARLRAALEQYHTRLVGEWAGPDDPYPTTFDAFMALVDSSVDADLSTSRRHRHRTLLHIDAESLADWAAARRNGRRPHFHLGPVVDRAVAELLTCEGEISMLVTRFGRPLRLGRSSRVVPTWLRDVILDRDGACRVCGSTRNLDIHHVVHWSNGGTTDPSNLAAVCSRCHRAHHTGEITVSGQPAQVPGPGRPDGLTAVNRHGIRLNRRRPPPRPAISSAPTVRYRHPLGQRLRQNDVWFNPNAP
jgi:hypothetical protein